MGRKRWVGLRSASFRRTLLVTGLILLFILGFLLGKKQQVPGSKQVDVLEQQVTVLEKQVEQLKENNKKESK